MTRLAVVLTRPLADPRSDGALLAAFLSEREEPAFAELVRRHGPLVWAACRRSLPDSCDAEDAFQATFLVLVRRAERLTSFESLGPWLYKVASWTARALRRKNARRRATFGTLSPAMADPRLESGAAFELDDLLLALPDRYRSALVLCHLQGLTHREAADRLGCAEGTVASLVSRALVKLRAKLTGHEPAAILALAVSGMVPATLSASVVRSAVAFRLSTLSVAASPAVVNLTEGVLRMFWLKKAAVAGVAVAMVLVSGVGIGLSIQHTPQSIAADDPPAKPATPPPSKSDPRPPTELDRLRLELELVRLQAQQTDNELRRLMSQADELTSQVKSIQENRTELAKRYNDLTARREELEKAVARPVPAQPRAGSRIVIRLSSEGPHPIAVSEIRADGSSGWEVTFNAKHTGDPAALAELQYYLARAGRDKAGPRQIRVAVENTVLHRDLQAVIKVIKDSDFPELKSLDFETVKPKGKGKDSDTTPGKPAPTRKVEIGGDGPPGGQFHVDVAVGETIRIAVHGGRKNVPFPDMTTDTLKVSADAEGYIVTGLRPGAQRLAIQDEKGREHSIRVEIKNTSGSRYTP